eukprot:TRINITY_DN81350_c0_g1_i1.p1 TRINITY_DN81350_c0_g1~~TRINITY_DN81350_c0_g1_i1.p1  ORF type:complete len:374 (-),score=48.08 TRINITY_DN81350_c0_g1_i1:44-1165(-)
MTVDTGAGNALRALFLRPAARGAEPVTPPSKTGASRVLSPRAPWNDADDDKVAIQGLSPQVQLEDEGTPVELSLSESEPASSSPPPWRYGSPRDGGAALSGQLSVPAARLPKHDDAFFGTGTVAEVYATTPDIDLARPVQGPAATVAPAAQPPGMRGSGAVVAGSYGIAPLQDFEWLRSLAREERRRLRQSVTLEDARDVLLEAMTSSQEPAHCTALGTARVPDGLHEEIQRMTQTAKGKVLALEEELANVTALQEAEMTALLQENKREKREARLQLLAQVAPEGSQRTAALAAVSHVAEYLEQERQSEAQKQHSITAAVARQRGLQGGAQAPLALPAAIQPSTTSWQQHLQASTELTNLPSRETGRSSRDER